MAKKRKKAVHALPVPAHRIAEDPVIAARERAMKAMQKTGLLPPTGGGKKREKKKGKGSK